MRKGNIFIKSYETVQRTILLFFAALVLFSSTTIFAQVIVPEAKKPPAVPQSTPPMPRPRHIPLKKKIAHNESPAPAEKSLQTDPKVNISFCVSEGNVRINGWDRNEIRAYVSGGSKVGFKVLQKREQNPALVRVLGFDPVTDKEIGLNECLTGELIELDVPRGAVIGLKSQESEIVIDSVARARIENVGGNISLRNISNGIEAGTHEGGVMVQNSKGPMSLTATTGNVIVSEVEPNEIGERFRARTRSGMVTLQSIGHSQVEIGTASGWIGFSGAVVSGGQYIFNTTSGSILLALPADSSCHVSATYRTGSFQSDIPLLNMNETPGSVVKKLTGLIGTGDANLNLTSISGRIYIQKK